MIPATERKSNLKNLPYMWREFYGPRSTEMEGSRFVRNVVIYLSEHVMSHLVTSAMIIQIKLC